MKFTSVLIIIVFMTVVLANIILGFDGNNKIDPRLQPYFEEFIKDCKKYKTDCNITNLTMDYTPVFTGAIGNILNEEGNVIGFANYPSFHNHFKPHIQIKITKEHEAYKTYLKSTIYHELFHSVFCQAHVDTPDHIMYYRDLGVVYTSLNWKRLVEEAFNGKNDNTIIGCYSIYK